MHKEYRIAMGLGFLTDPSKVKGKSNMRKVNNQYMHITYILYKLYIYAYVLHVTADYIVTSKFRANHF